MSNTNNCVDCGTLPGGSVVTISEPQQPYCEQCSDNNTVCEEKIDAKCVIYHLRDCSLPSGLTALGLPSCTDLETILDSLNDLVGGSFNVPFTPVNTNSVKWTAGGTAGHAPKADVAISPDAGNQAEIRNNGLYAPKVNPDYRVKIDPTDAPDYLDNQIIGDESGCISISIQKHDGALYIKPTLNITCLLQTIQTDHLQEFCTIISKCSCYLTIQDLTGVLSAPCPDGYSLIDGLCQSVQIVDATPAETEYNLQTVTNANWSKGGALVFKNGFHVNGAGPGATFASDIASGFVTQIYTPNVWLNGTTTPFGGGNSTFLGPMNRAAIWSNPYLADTTFVIPVNVPSNKTYYIGLGVDNVGSIIIASPNGSITNLLAQDTAAASGYYTGSSTWNFDIWNVYPVQLQAGLNFITVNGHDTGVAFGFAIEIYNNTVAELQAATLDVDYLSDPSTYPLTSNPYSNLDLIFTSRCARQDGAITANSATCPDNTWTLDTTTGSSPTSPCQAINNPVANWTCRKVFVSPFTGYSVALQWDIIPNALSYTVEQKPEGDPDTSYSLTVGSPVANPTSGTLVNLQVDNLPLNGYTFRIRADFADCSTAWREVIVD